MSHFNGGSQDDQCVSTPASLLASMRGGVKWLFLTVSFPFPFSFPSYQGCQTSLGLELLRTSGSHFTVSNRARCPESRGRGRKETVRWRSEAWVRDSLLLHVLLPAANPWRVSTFGHVWSVPLWLSSSKTRLLGDPREPLLEDVVTDSKLKNIYTYTCMCVWNKQEKRFFWPLIMVGDRKGNCVTQISVADNRFHSEALQQKGAC